MYSFIKNGNPQLLAAVYVITNYNKKQPLVKSSFSRMRMAALGDEPLASWRYAIITLVHNSNANHLF